MSDFEILHPRFNRFILGNAALEKLATGFRWVEGPVWFGDAGTLLFSDIPNDRILRWIDGEGVSSYRHPSNYANGHTRDKQGRLISCEHGKRRVTRTEHDGSITVIADQYNGKRLNSPNDVVVKSDNSIWFSDPHYGIMMDYEGFKADQQLDCNVYRYHPESNRLQTVITELDCPNGLCFSPDESKLYVADTGFLHDDNADRRIQVYDVDNAGEITQSQRFYTPDNGAADGFRSDSDGNIWTSAGDGVHCVSADGELLGKILVPETVANVCFGGRADAKNRLFICASTSIYSIFLNRTGIQTP